MYSNLQKQIASMIPVTELNMLIKDLYSATTPNEAMRRAGLTLDEVIHWWDHNDDYRVQIGEEAAQEVESTLISILQRELYEILQMKYKQELKQKIQAQINIYEEEPSIRLQGRSFHFLRKRSVRKRITTTEIVMQVSYNTNLEYRDVELAIYTLLEVIANHIKYGHEVRLPGFGTFLARRSKKRAGEMTDYRMNNTYWQYLPMFKPSRTFFSQQKRKKK